jgi:hypothetical protein
MLDPRDARTLNPGVNDPRVGPLDPYVAGAPAAGSATALGGPQKSAASWGAIFAGAFVAASVSLILLALGTGLDLAEISPWPNRGVSATTFTVTTAIWLIVMQWVSAALGGYIAGRLRTRWHGTHAHEIFFRDTAHGLVTWSVATVLVAAVLAGSAASAISGGVRTAGQAAAAGAQGAAQGAMASAGSPAPAGDMGYGMDKLFRGPPGSGTGGSTTPTETLANARGEATRIVGNAMATGTLPDADRSYLADLVAAQTGVSGAEAQRRVDDFISAAQATADKVRAAADAARKAAAEASIYTALSLLIGAFIASVSAAVGGRLRDQHP